MAEIALTNGATSGEPIEVRNGVIADIAAAEQDNWRQVTIQAPNITNPIGQYVSDDPTYAIQPDGSVIKSSTVESVGALELKKRLIQHSAMRRWSHMQSGTTFNGIAIQTDDVSIGKINGALTAMERGTITSVRWKTKGGWVTLDINAMRAIFDTVATFVQACYSEEEAVEGLINAGTYTTKAQIDGHAWPT